MLETVHLRTSRRALIISLPFFFFLFFSFYKRVATTENVLTSLQSSTISLDRKETTTDCRWEKNPSHSNNKNMKSTWEHFISDWMMRINCRICYFQIRGWKYWCGAEDHFLGDGGKFEFSRRYRRHRASASVASDVMGLLSVSSRSLTANRFTNTTTTHRHTDTKNKQTEKQLI